MEKKEYKRMEKEKIENNKTIDLINNIGGNFNYISLKPKLCKMKTTQKKGTKKNV